MAKRIAQFVESVEYSDLKQSVVSEVKRRILDSIGVMAGAYRDVTPRIVMREAMRFPTEGGSRLFGSGVRVAPDWASFANGVLVRYLDFNDTYLSREALHPSDTIPALIAVADDLGSSGKELMTSIVVAYEVTCWLADSLSLRDNGYDHVACIAFGTAAGASKLMGLETNEIVNAINLTGVAAAALRQTRAGELSMWKGCAAANAARHGVFATLLARGGVTGPSPIFEGEMGFIRVISRDFREVPLPLNDRGDFRLLKTHIKRWPVEYHSMSAVEAAIDLVRSEGINASEVSQIKVNTFSVSYRIIVKDPEKWNPKTRETADHSLPYIVARTLVDGDIWLESFDEERLREERVRELMRLMKVDVYPRYDELYPEAIPNSIEVVDRRGRTLSREVLYPKGHCSNPLSRDELTEKFKKLSIGVFGEELAEEVVKSVEGLENSPDVSELVDCLSFDRR
ncbi:MAG: MmgE/PrpD family protein [Aigarchaeota archaeon]|nr:MmgE/PrpD family protein [Aigarchaeota archaeon]MDW8092864.1 MmgE/PrpD family protein [Nitrososphaerota archaeon]